MKIYKQFNFQRAVFLKKVEFSGSVKMLCLTQSTYPLKVWHPRCVRSIIQSCSVYISIYTYSHEHNNIIISSDI